jgi:A/G-specific adenine glycosylase
MTLVTLPSDRRAFRRSVLNWFATNGRDLPWRKNRTPFRILVAEVLLQHTHAGKVARVYDALIDKYGSPRVMADASPSDLLGVIRPLGLVKRATTLRNLASTLVEDWAGEVPSSRRSLADLRGVGPYTAAAVRCFAFGKRDAVVDFNVLRLMERFFGLATMPEPTARFRAAVTAANECLPKRNVEAYNWALLDLGAVICKVKRPRCKICPIGTGCEYWTRGLSRCKVCLASTSSLVSGLEVPFTGVSGV